ncbi:hypothetical protein [Chitinophaga sp.]|uniref:hypothetical protein n=1 Tax=Chitinophaga sp. TaxID=1869181 RepID=UPI0031D11E4B
MRTLACSITVNGVSRKISLRKKAKEKKYLVVMKGEVLEYTFDKNNILSQSAGPAITEAGLSEHIEWMIRNYFGPEPSVQ